MQSARRIAAATLTAALTVSGIVTASAATATPPAHAASHANAKHGNGHGKANKASKASKHGHKHGQRGTKPAKADRAVAKVRGTARVLDHLLRNAGTDERLYGLSETSVNAIRANLTADHDALVALVKSVEADPTTARTAYATLRTYQTSNYAVAVGQARMAERLQARAATYADYVATLSAEQQGAYAQALTHLNTVLTSALAVKATSPRTALGVINNELRNALHQFSLVHSNDDWNHDEDDENDEWDHHHDHDHEWGHDWNRG